MVCDPFLARIYIMVSGIPPSIRGEQQHYFRTGLNIPAYAEKPSLTRTSH